ncbi:MAG: TIGR02281 family clan AA aspartic protease [Sulfuricellaceae bacterium]|nr:TIGR02281 family clan AA aspartic protease [Sulfuricellaceae bacterium]
MKKSYFSLSFAVIGLVLSLPAHATRVSIVALFNGKAMVTINSGSPKMLNEGDKTPEGVRLISADSNRAVLEIDGKRETLELGQGVSTGGVQASSGNASVTLTADAQGHFVVMGAINGKPVRLVVDTGATMIAMSADEAKRLGIRYEQGAKGFASTANGVTPVFKVTLDTVKVGDITLHGVDAMVNPQPLPVILLGNSFLNRVNMNREGNLMVMTKRF